jgi:hypothetical protein
MYERSEQTVGMLLHQKIMSLRRSDKHEILKHPVRSEECKHMGSRVTPRDYLTIAQITPSQSGMTFKESDNLEKLRFSAFGDKKCKKLAFMPIADGCIRKPGKSTFTAIIPGE